MAAIQLSRAGGKLPDCRESCEPDPSRRYPESAADMQVDLSLHIGGNHENAKQRATGCVQATNSMPERATHTCTINVKLTSLAFWSAGASAWHARLLSLVWLDVAVALFPSRPASLPQTHCY